MREFFLSYADVDFNFIADGFSIVGSAKPQIQRPDNKVDEFGVSAKPLFPHLDEVRVNDKYMILEAKKKARKI